MSKGESKSSTTTVKSEQSPEQRKILQAEMGHYMPDGEFVDKPTYNPAEHNWMGENRVAGFNQDNANAFEATRQTAFEHRPVLEQASHMAMDAAGPTGQYEGLGKGWSTDENGVANYAAYDPNSVNEFMNPYTNEVIDNSINDLKRANDIALRSNNDAATEAGAFGGSRHGVVDSLTNADYLRKVSDMTSNLRYSGYNTAQAASLDQYNRGRDEGQQAMDRNKQVQDDNMKRLSDASDRIAKLSQQNQDMTAGGINALQSIGDIQRQRDQDVRDTSYDELMSSFMWPAQLGQMLSGFTPAPTQTQTQTQSGGGGSIWGTVGSAAAQAAMTAMLSDETAKENIEEADPDVALNEIRKLAKRGLSTFEYTDEAQEELGAPAGRRTGFMAQDLEEATGKEAPEFEGGFKGVDIAEHIGRLTHAVAAIDKKLTKLAA